MFETPLFILDIANNHGGDAERASDIICAHAETRAKHKDVRFAVKFQYRDLDKHSHGDDAYAEKFKQSQLSSSEEKWLVDVARWNGFLVGATPFDPSSVKKVNDFGLDFVKIASCSAVDGEVVDAVKNSGLPVVASTGGLSLDGIRDLVVALDPYADRAAEMAFMHCVSLYPTPPERCELKNIVLMGGGSNRYGWSSHEHPDATESVQLATALGATLFERHIGIEPGLNAYSATPAQIDRWVEAWKRANRMLGDFDAPPRADRSDERAALARVERKDQGRPVAGAYRSRKRLDGRIIASPRSGSLH